MRKALLCGILFFALFYSSKAQQTLPSLDYKPQSPTTAAFTRYGDIPVDLSTGVPDISIPIYILSTHGINVPISISYHASGVKVQDIASSVGLGWVLNAGGVVTRSVFGQPDERLDLNTSGATVRPPFKNTEQLLNFYNSHSADLNVLYNDLYFFYLNKYNYDYFSDRYYYSLGNGESGIFRRDFVDDTIRLIPYKPITVKFFYPDIVATDRQMIEMIAADGTSYYFKKNFFDLLHLTKIVNNTKTYSVVFYSHYEWLQIFNYNDVAHFERTEAYIGNSQLECSQDLRVATIGGSQRLPDLSSNNDEIIIIDSIVSSEAVIRFSYAEDRQDGPPGGKPKSRLTKIQVFSKSSSLLIKEVNLSHSYKSKPHIGDPSKRLFLDSMQIGAYKEEKYTFKYNSETLPEYPSIGGPPYFYEDFWGYYNDQMSGSLLSAEFSPASGSGNRFPNENFAKAGTLEEISYPTGGKTIFEFESNRVSPGFYGFSSPNIPADGKIGGLRVKKITNYPYQGAPPQIKLYEYVCSLTPVYGYMWRDMFVYGQNAYNYFRPKDFDNSWCSIDYTITTNYSVCVTKPFGRVIGSSRAPLVYDQVIEYLGDSTLNTGKTIYYYELPDQRADDYNSDPRFQGPYPHDNGNYIPHLLKKEEYKNENGKYKMVRKTETVYDIVKQKTFTTGFSLASDLEFKCFSGPESDAFIDYAVSHHNDYFQTLNYKDNKGYTDLKLPHQTRVYDFVDDNNFLKTTTTYQYNQYAQQIAATTTSSKGEVLTTKYKYPVDYSSQAPYKSMIDKHMLSPVIEQSTFKNDTSFLQSIKTNYNFWDPSGRNWGNSSSNLILPQTIEAKKGANAVEARIRYYSYDDKGNPVSVSKENDTRQLYIWAYNKKYPIAHVFNAAEGKVSYTSFEDETTGNWIINGAVLVINDNTAPTGKKCFQLALNNLFQSVSSSEDYTLSYWYKTGSTVSVSGTSSDVITSQPKNGWIHVKRKVTGTSEIRISGNGYIDEVRLYPATAQMTTYAYEPLVGMTAQCDINGRITYYEYDASGRLTLIRDDDRNVLKRVCYNYQGQPENCGVNSTPRWEPTGITRCKPCLANTNYITNMLQRQEKDNNINSDSHGDTRWMDTELSGNCYIQPDWQFTANTRCVTIGGQITGEQEREQKDVNPCSILGQTRWISVGTNTTACTPPSVFKSLDVSGSYYQQNCSSTQLPVPFYVSMPSGSYTSAASVSEATNLARQEAQRQANVSGNCKTVYVRLVKENEVINTWISTVEGTADYYFRFYADAAGTIRTTLPSDVVINWQHHSYYSDNGGTPYGEGSDPAYIQAYAGMDEVSLKSFETLNCYEGNCHHFEAILSTGRYVIIP